MASGNGAGGQQQQLAAWSMPPPPPRPKRKEVVLEEDEWTTTLEAIIERDFFPELPKLESKIAWIQAVRSGDPEQIRQAQLLIAQRRAAAGGRPHTGATPAGGPLFTPGGTAARAMRGDTPYIPLLPHGLPPGRPLQDTPSAGGGGDEEAEGGAPQPPPPVSLDTFLALHTSEDNASFQELLEAVNKRRRLRAAAQLVAATDPKLVITEGREKTDGFGTTGQDPGTLVTWRHNPKNALYFGREKEVVPYSEAELEAMVAGAPKAINHGATRFPKHLQASASATPSTSSAAGAVAGSGGGSGGRPGGAAAVAAAAGGTRGFDILATPSFDPGAEATPFMTWGDIEGTPLRIEAEDLPPGAMMAGPSFFIREGSRKEQKGLELASKAGASLRRKGAGLRGGTPLVTSTLAAAAAARRQGTGLGVRGGTARPGTGSRPATGQQGKPMSEAARRLASSLHKGRKLAADDMGLRSTYQKPTPGSSVRRTGATATPAAVSGGFGSSWSTNPTPSRSGAVPTSPAVHATLEEEESRVQALLRARQKVEEGKAQLQAARTAAKEAMRGLPPQGQGPVQQQQQQQQQHKPPDAGAAADLTAGLLHF